MRPFTNNFAFTFRNKRDVVLYCIFLSCSFLFCTIDVFAYSANTTFTYCNDKVCMTLSRAQSHEAKAVVSCMDTIIAKAKEDSAVSKQFLVQKQDTNILKEGYIDEVVVKGQSEFTEGDRTRIAITKNLRRGTVSTIEMLGKIRNFYYDFRSRQLYYNNSTNIAVLVDSVPKDMSYLSNIQHMRFDRIEIIDHPQGLYQGYDVLVNIHTKENYEGYEGLVANNGGVNFNEANDKKLIWEYSDLSFSAVKQK